MRNALYRKCGRGEITEKQLKIAIQDIQADMDRGALEIPAIERPEIWTRADKLTAKYALSTQCRTLDVLHVAVALQLGLKTFGTTDQRQTVVAERAGLKVISPT